MPKSPGRSKRRPRSSRPASLRVRRSRHHLDHGIEDVDLCGLEGELRDPCPLLVPFALDRLELFLKPINMLRQDADNQGDIIPDLGAVVLTVIRGADRGLVGDAISRDTHTGPTIIPRSTRPVLVPRGKAPGAVGGWADPAPIAGQGRRPRAPLGGSPG